MILEGIEEFKNIDRRRENALCVLAGYVAGMLIGFNGFMWSQAVIVEVYPFSLLSFVGVLCCLLRWVYAPHQMRYLYWALFLFGVCFTKSHDSHRRRHGDRGRHRRSAAEAGARYLPRNSVLFISGYIAKTNGKLPGFENNLPLWRFSWSSGPVQSWPGSGWPR